MRTRLFGAIAIAALVVTACGGDDDGGSGGGSPQDQVADMMIDMLDETAETEGIEGFEIDEGCLRDKVDQLSDEDARAIVAAGPDGEPEVSDEAEAVAGSMFECFDMSGVDIGELDTDG